MWGEGGEVEWEWGCGRGVVVRGCGGRESGFEWRGKGEGEIGGVGGKRMDWWWKDGGMMVEWWWNGGRMMAEWWWSGGSVEW